MLEWRLYLKPFSGESGAEKRAMRCIKRGKPVQKKGQKRHRKRAKSASGCKDTTAPWGTREDARESSSRERAGTGEHRERHREGRRSGVGAEGEIKVCGDGPVTDK